MNRIVTKTINLAMAIAALFSTIVSAELKKKDFTPEFVAECKAKAEAGDADGEMLFGRALLKGWGVASNHVAAVRWLTKAAGKGNADAQYHLGNCYRIGVGVKKDAAKCFELYLKAAENGNSDAQCNLAILYIEGKGCSKNEAAGIAWALESAKGNNANGEGLLGQCYHEGIGVDKNLPIAFEWFLKSAEHGSPLGQNEVAICYRFGRGIEKNIAKAIEWYTKIVESGNSTAIGSIIDCYLSERDDEESMKEARKWCHKAIEKDYYRELFDYATDYAFGEHGKDENDEMAFRWYLLLADCDVCPENIKNDCNFAKRVVAEHYETGIGVDKDEGKAVEWYRKAAENGDGKAMREMASFYRYGILGVEKNLSEAIGWYRKAAEDGDAVSQYKLAQCYWRGIGIAQSDSGAIDWLKKASENGVGAASFLLAMLYVDGIGGMAKDHEKVEQFLQNAVTLWKKDSSSSPESNFHLGWCYANGFGTAKDDEESLRCFQRARRLEFNMEDNRREIDYLKKTLDIDDIIMLLAILRDYKTIEDALQYLSQSPHPLYNEILCHAMVGWVGESYMGDMPNSFNGIDGRTYSGRILTSDEGGQLFYIFNGQYCYKLYAGALCDKDKNEIQSKMARYMDSHIWKDGYWLTRENLSGINRAKELIDSKSPKGKQHVEIFQIIGDNAALARIGIKDKTAYYDDRPIIQLKGNDIGKTYSDGESVVFDNLYWASTYTYETSGGRTTTVKTLSPDYHWAIMLVRKAMHLYDDTDPHFGKFSKCEEVVYDNISNYNKKVGKQNRNIDNVRFGSCFVISADGFFLTNFHVVKNGTKFEVLLDGQTFPATCVDFDSDLDIALLKTDVGKKAIPTLPFSGRRKANLGEDVYAVGYPRPTLQGTSVKVTKGVISGLRGIMDDPHCYQIDATIQPGNSGGPLVDSAGNVIGMAVAKLKNTESMMESGDIAQNVNYAIKSSFILAFLDSNPECEYRIDDKPPKTSGNSSGISENVTKACGLVIAYE